MTRIEWIERYLVEAEKLIYENRIEEGFRIMNDLLFEEPGYGSLHNHLGWAYMYYSSADARAELHLKMAIKFNTEFTAAYLHLGTLLIRLGRYDEALEYLEKGLTNYSASRTTFLEKIASVYELKKDYTKAIRKYKEALASTAGFDAATYTDAIKRCRKKRWVLMFTF
jgi:tetratricopeptide (TPR) repeat protein